MRSAAIVLLAAPLALCGVVKLKPLSADERRLLDAPGSPKVVGVHRALPADAVRKGKWQKTATGQQQWRLEIQSPGAAALRVEFASIQAGEGKTEVCDKGGKRCYGPYTAQTLMDQGSFWSDVVDGDTIVIQYTGGARSEAPPFRLARISHMR
jgi:hypothetical protein